MNSILKHILIQIIGLIFFGQSLKSQIATEYGSPVIWNKISTGKYIMSGVDTISKDSILISKNEYLRKNAQGRLIEKLTLLPNSISIRCDDEGPKLTGKWIRYYSSGEIEEIGQIECNRKIGNWIYFYKNGSINRYEKYDKFVLFEFGHSAYLNGAYVEYYEDGTIKVLGNYKVLEEYVKYQKLNIDTYETMEECCRWQPKSFKFGKWVEFDENGDITNELMYEMNVKDSLNLRELADRYINLNINEIMKSN